MKKVSFLLFLIICLTSCSSHIENRRISGLEDRINKNSDRIQTLYKIDNVNPIIVESQISLMRMSTVIVRATVGDRIQMTTGVAVKKEEVVDGKMREFHYIWTVAHSITNASISKGEGEDDKPFFVLKKAKESHVWFRNEYKSIIKSAPRKAEIIAYDLSIDIALLRVDTTINNVIIPDIRFSKERAMIGERVFAVGHPGARNWTVSSGIVSSYNLRMNYIDEKGKFKFGGEMMDSNLKVSYGFSGGPVFNPVTGEILGFISRMSSDTKDALIIPIEHIFTWAKDGGYEYALPD